MSGMTNGADIDFSSYELVPLTDMTVDALNGLAQSCEKTAAWKDRVRRMLIALKPKVGHGKWQAYCEEHFSNLGSVRTLQLYMQPETKPDELAAICDQTTAKSANVAHLKTGQVTVVVPEKASQSDPDPNPAPRTNTKHSAATAKVSEEKKPRTAAVPVTAELLETDDAGDEADRREAALGQLEEIVEILGLTTILKIAVSVDCYGHDKQERAALLRKAADELDPPKPQQGVAEGKAKTKAVATPSAAELIKLIPKHFPQVLRQAAQDWAEHKQSQARRDRIQSIVAWTKALELMETDKPATVAAKVNKALANNWKGWDHDGSGSKVAAKGPSFFRNPGPRKPIRYDNIDYGDDG